MPIAKKILSRSSDTWIMCNWFECEKPGYELYKTILHDHAKEYPCDHKLAQHVNFVFCTERHKQLFLHSHKEMGKLPPGYKLAI